MDKSNITTSTPIKSISANNAANSDNISTNSSNLAMQSPSPNNNKLAGKSTTRRKYYSVH